MGELSKNFLLIILLLSSLVITQIVVSANFEGESEVQNKQLSLEFVENVLSINLSACNSTEVVGSNIYLSLKDGSKVKINWEKGSIFSCYIEPSGVSVQVFEDPLSLAKKFLQRYQMTFNKTYCESFIGLLEKATLNQNQTIKGEGVTFQLQYFPNYEDLHKYPKRTFDLIWQYNINNIPVPGKSVHISISKDGYISFFRDTWELYYVASSEINVSEGQAISVARAYAEDYALKWGQKIVFVDAQFGYVNDRSKLRGNDEYACYPGWSVAIRFDKRNNDGMHGVDSYGVLIWADTGEVFYAMPDKCVGGSVPQPDYLPITLIAATLVASATGCLHFMYRKRKMKLQ